MRLIAAAALTLLLAACMEGPRTPKSNEAPSYSSRMPIELADDGTIHRLELEATRYIGIFDADGVPQRCGRIDPMSGPIAETATVAEARIAEFDPAVCRGSPQPAVCFSGHACRIPSYCPHATIDLGRDDVLAGIDDFHRLVEIANAPLPTSECDAAPARCSDPARDALDTEKALAPRRGARFALGNAGFGDWVQPDPEQPRRWFSPGDTTLGQNQPRDPRANAMIKPARHAGPLPDLVVPAGMHGYVISFDAPPDEIHLSYSPPLSAPAGRTRTIDFDARGARNDRIDALEPAGRYPSHPDPRQALAKGAHAQEMLVIVESDQPELRLVAATSTHRTRKPFVAGRKSVFWFATTGRAPYAVYVEPKQSNCDAHAPDTDVRAHRDDADWPPAAHVGAIEPNPRSLLAAAASARFELLVWAWWAAAIGTLWILALLALALRWASRRHSR